MRNGNKPKIKMGISQKSEWEWYIPFNAILPSYVYLHLGEELK